MKPEVISGIIILAVGVHFGYHSAYVGPKVKLEQINRQLKEVGEEQELRRQVAASFQQLEEYQKRLAPKPDPDRLLQDVGRLAKGVGIEVGSISPEPSKRREGFTHLGYGGEADPEAIRSAFLVLVGDADARRRHREALLAHDLASGRDRVVRVILGAS